MLLSLCGFMYTDSMLAERRQRSESDVEKLLVCCIPPLTGACGPVFPPSCVTVNELESSVHHFTESHQKITLSENGFLFC